MKSITIASWITIGRILLTPIIIAFLIASWFKTALFLFAIACITDVLDGYIARSRNECTLLGACLDPIADKLLVLTTLGYFAYSYSFFWLNVLFWTLVIKECCLIVMGALYLIIFGELAVMPTRMGKISTFFMMVLLAMLLCNVSRGTMLTPLSRSGILIIIFLVVLCMVQYMVLGATNLYRKLYG